MCNFRNAFRRCFLFEGGILLSLNLILNRILMLKSAIMPPCVDFLTKHERRFLNDMLFGMVLLVKHVWGFFVRKTRFKYEGDLK